ncbi:MAG TPA: decarboxylating 6-phosphogluconate dehydrogenase [Planctomycetota bacterium]|nr:decarboxylating 6-phosphogluconate dehydrogenase [Planctomycetota bacterium]
MQLGMVGLGRMGANIVRRLMKQGHECIVFDMQPDSVKALEREGARGASSLEDFVRKLKTPRAVWIMVPAGSPTEDLVTALGERLQGGDVLIDGGNTYFKDDIRRAYGLAGKGIHYLDVGTSGGVFGLERGYCLMIGGPKGAFEMLKPIFQALAPGKDSAPPTPGRPSGSGTAEQGYLYCGPSGAGHFVKMVHNGIEYGLMQAYAEGFDILRGAAGAGVPAGQSFDFDLPEIAEVWRRGSVVGSWLLDLTSSALAENPELTSFSGSVSDSGEGRWTIQTAIEEAIAAPVLSASLYTRFRSRVDHSFGEKVLSAMRHKFGGHIERAAGG